MHYLETNWNTLRLELKERILIIRFETSNPVNAFTQELAEELIAFFRQLEAESYLSAIILTGRENIFCGGMDLTASGQGTMNEVGLGVWRKKMQLGPMVCEAIERLEPITIAAIEGPCIGAGVALAVSCDFRVMGEQAIMYAAEIQRGMTMSWGSIPRMVNLVGPARTKRLFALAEKVDAVQALSWGLADEVATNCTAVEKAMKLATQAATMSPIPLRMCKQGINAAANALNWSISHMDTDQLILTQTTDDFKEGVSAFLQKREAEFKGR